MKMGVTLPACLKRKGIFHKQSNWTPVCLNKHYFVNVTGTSVNALRIYYLLLISGVASFLIQ